MPSLPSKVSRPAPHPIETRDRVPQRRPFGFEPAFVAETPPGRALVDWLWRSLSFWTAVPLIGMFGFVYLFLFTDDLYESESVVALQSASSMSSALGPLSGLLGGATSSSSQMGALSAFITSRQMLMKLDRRFHLRQVYSAPERNPFSRLASDASDEDFLDFYRGMVSITWNQSTGLITIDVLDYDADRAAAMQTVILDQGAKFINGMSATVRAATVKYAQDEFTKAMKAVETAQPYQRTVAEAELAAAQQGLASVSGVSNRQQVFLVPVSNPATPTDTSYPDRLEDEAAVLLAASVFYMVGYLLLSNVRDHRRV